MSPNIGAFATVAAVLPLLFLAIIYEERMFEGHPDLLTESDRQHQRRPVAGYVARILVMTYLAGAEGLALGTVANGHPTDLKWWFVSVAVPFSVGGIANGIARRTSSRGCRAS